VIVEVLPFGPAAVLVEIDPRWSSAGVAGAIDRAAIVGVDEVVPGAHTVLVRVDPARVGVRELGARLREITVTDDGAAPPSPPVEIPVVYDGDDLSAVAELTGLSVAEVIERHCARTLTAAFCGFSPGFAYLVGLDPALAVPRRATPRTAVPAGAVAIAGPYSAVYPSATPGGWQLLGRTSRRVWDPAAPIPALLTPGTSVRFRSVGP
jgi:KipI family sensor histidine kinase inhibitor